MYTVTQIGGLRDQGNALSQNNESVARLHRHLRFVRMHRPGFRL